MRNRGKLTLRLFVFSLIIRSLLGTFICLALPCRPYIYIRICAGITVNRDNVRASVRGQDQFH